MNNEARKMWEQPAGLELFKRMLEGGPLDSEQRQLIDKMKKIDPPVLLGNIPLDARIAAIAHQLPLPGFANVPTPAERVFVQIAQQWRKGFAAVEGAHAPPRVLDELALAALLIAREHGVAFTDYSSRQVMENITLADRRPVPWIERLPWSVVECVLTDAGEHLQLEELIDKLNHHNSALRIWAMEVAWIARSRIDAHSVVPLLLENVAGTLCGVEMAWGLAGELFDSTEDFDATVEKWRPMDFSEQYEVRVALFRDRGLLATQAYFWRMEGVCRRIIADIAMAPDGVG